MTDNQLTKAEKKAVTDLIERVFQLAEILAWLKNPEDAKALLRVAAMAPKSDE